METFERGVMGERGGAADGLMDGVMADAEEERVAAVV